MIYCWFHLFVSISVHITEQSIPFLYKVQVGPFILWFNYFKFCCCSWALLMLFNLLYISLPVPIFQCSAFCINFLVHNLRDFLNIQQTGSLYSLCWDPGKVRTGHSPAWQLITSTERAKGQSSSQSATQKHSVNCGRPNAASDREGP